MRRCCIAMKTRLIRLVAVGMLTLSCSRQTDFGEPIPESVATLSVQEARGIRNHGRTIYVRGTVRDVCKDEGCWFVVSSGSSEMIARYSNKGVGIPVISSGEVVIKGVVRDTIIANTYVPELHATGVKFVTSQP